MGAQFQGGCVWELLSISLLYNFRSISFSQGSRGIASPRPILMLISWLWVPLEQASSINSIPNPRDSKPVVIISQKTFIMVSFGILTILKCTVQ